MPNFILTSNMNLPNPVPGVDPGPDYADNLQSSLNVIDQHNHAPGSGVQIDPTGMNINSDLTWNNTNNAIALRSVRFFSQLSPIPASSPDIGCLYESGADLYYNDGNGNQVRITSSGSVAGSSGTITGLPSGSASATFVAVSGSFVFQQATSTAANLDVGSVAIRYPGSYPTPSGNYIQLQAPASLATGYSFTFPATTAASSGAFLTSDNSGVLSYTNTDNATLEISGSTLLVKPGGIGRSQLATVGSGVSSSSGSFSVTASSSFTNVTNLSVTITTIGGPVMVVLQPDGVGAASPGAIFVSQVSGTARIRITNGITPDRVWQLISSASTGPLETPAAFSFIDTPSAGTHTYIVSVNCSATVQIQVVNLVLFAQEF